MPIDVSSYYPEVPSNGGSDDGFSLNNRRGGLFDSAPLPPNSSFSEQPPEGGAAVEAKTVVNVSEEEPQTTELPEVPVKPDAGNMPPAAESPDEEPPTFAGRVAEIISWVLTPLFMPVYGLILAFGVSILQVVPIGMRVALTLIVAGICIVIPMLLIVLLKKLKVISDLGLNKQNERPIPYVITSLCFSATGLFMASKGAPMWLTMFFVGGALAGLINLIINYKWKISAHAAGIAGVVALLIRIAKDGSPMPNLMMWLLITTFMAGLLGSARVYLCRHTVWQVLAGYAVGFCSVFFLTMIN